MSERAREDRPGAVKTAVYNAPEPRATSTSAVRTTEDVQPADSVRWGPVLAGLFAALATLIALSVLGLAIGLSTYNVGDPLGNFGLGAGIWGAITALIAFLVGGVVAGRTAAFRGTNSGILNGAMVWFVAIPLLIYLLGGGLSALARTAGGVVSTGAQVLAPAAGQAAGAVTNDPALQATAQAGGSNLGQAAQATAQVLGSQVTPQDVQEATDTAARTAWGTLLSLGLAAGASMLGGYLGGRARAPEQHNAATSH